MDLARRRPPTLRVRALLVAVALVLLSSAPNRAAAHAALVGSDPRDGATLSAAPATVELSFDEEIATPAYVVVTAPDGTAAAAGPADVRGGTVTQRVDTSTVGGQAGRWRIAFRVVSVDGHAVSDELGFTVEGDAASSTPAAAAAGSATDANSSAAGEQPFWREPAGYLALGAGVVLIATLLLLWPVGRRRDA